MKVLKDVIANGRDTRLMQVGDPFGQLGAVGDSVEGTVGIQFPDNQTVVRDNECIGGNLCMDVCGVYGPISEPFWYGLREAPIAVID